MQIDLSESNIFSATIITSFDDINSSWKPSFALPQQQQYRIVGQRPKVFAIFDLCAIALEHHPYRLRGRHS